MSLEVEPLPLSPFGKLYSFTTIRHSSGTTYAGYVDFPEKIRVFGHLAYSSSDMAPTCDMTVQVVAAKPMEDAKISAPIDFKFQAMEAVR
jgi:uncharacterized OB-fold protein